MAAGIARSLIAAVLLVALSGCEQTPTKPDAPKLDLAETYNLASEAYAEQDWAEAEKQFVILTRESPGEAEPWFKLGNIFARTLRTEPAIKAYRETLVREPQHVKAWHNMAVLQLREAGKSFGDREILLKPDDPLHDKTVKIQKTIDELVN
jgi:cytochrome c-type biogenesis protein CcmH/NrfG